jgi:hypothetical protein
MTLDGGSSENSGPFLLHALIPRTAPILHPAFH